MLIEDASFPARRSRAPRVRPAPHSRVAFWVGETTFVRAASVRRFSRRLNFQAQRYGSVRGAAWKLTSPRDLAKRSQTFQPWTIPTCFRPAEFDVGRAVRCA